MTTAYKNSRGSWYTGSPGRCRSRHRQRGALKKDRIPCKLNDDLVNKGKEPEPIRITGAPGSFQKNENFSRL